MNSICKTYAPLDVELKAVVYMVVGDHVDVFLRKNITTETIEETHDDVTTEYKIQSADEVYFQVDFSVSEDDIKSNFDKYWTYGEQWEDNSNCTNEEIISQLKQENEELKQCIIEISALI